MITWQRQRKLCQWARRHGIIAGASEGGTREVCPAWVIEHEGKAFHLGKDAAHHWLRGFEEGLRERLRKMKPSKRDLRNQD